MLMKNISILTREQCTGCGACVEICVHKAINFQYDDEGFPVPTVSEAECVLCGMCVKVCPAINPPNKHQIREAYAAQMRDKELLLDSTSGGVFAVVSEEFIRSNGIVYGCIWDEDYNAIICKATEISQLSPMKGSKYVWSWAGNTYPEIKKYLDDGRRVLFTGLPCQVAGLKNYLHREYKDLYLIDFLCSGAPSPMVFRKYLEYICPSGDYRNLNLKFRDKKPYGVGVHISYNGKKPRPRGEYITNPYYYAFYSHLLDRRSCFQCQYGTNQRISDITIGDYWGVENYHQGMNITAGVSALMVNTEKGKLILDGIKDRIDLVSTRPENIARHNNLKCDEKPQIRKVSAIREGFFSEIASNGWKAAEKEYLHDSTYYKKWIRVMMPDIIRTIARRIKNRNGRRSLS